MICGFPLAVIIRNCGLHFLLGWWVASQVSWWTLTIYWPTCSKSRTVASSTLPYVFWLSVSFSIVAHAFEDYLIGKF